MAKSSTQSNKAIKVGVITDQTGVTSVRGDRQRERGQDGGARAGDEVNGEAAAYPEDGGARRRKVGNLMTRGSIQWAEGASNKPLVADDFKSS